MRSIAPWLLVLAVLPRVEDPWPDAVGLEFPFAMATGGVVLAGAVFSVVAREKRERAIELGGACGFLIGSLFYLVVLAAQLISAL